MRITILALSSALSLSAWGQDGAMQAVDRLEIKQTLDTWYRIEQGPSRDEREHCGWARERIEPVEEREWRYEYSYESEANVRRMTESGETPQYVHEKVTAQLDASFGILKLDAELEVAGRKATLQVLAGAEGRTVEVASLDGRSRRIQEAADSTVMHTLALALLRERQGGGLVKPGSRERVLTDAAYDYDEIKLRCDVRAQGRLAYPGGRSIPVVPVEFRPGGATEDAKPVISLLLDRYGRIVEVIGDSECYVRTMAQSEKDARPEDMGVAPGGRRDPFEKVKKSVREDPPVDPDKAVEELQRLTEAIIAMAATDLERADQLYEEFLVVCEPAMKQAGERSVARGLMGALRRDAYDAVGRGDHELRLAGKLSEKIRVAAEREDAAAAKNLFGALKALLGRFLGGRDPAPAIEKITAEAQTVVETFTARRELKEMNLVLTGTSVKVSAVSIPVEYDVRLISTSSPVRTKVQMKVRDAWAIINDTSYREGDELGDKGVKLEKITQFNCTVSYKGAVRDLELPK